MIPKTSLSMAPSKIIHDETVTVDQLNETILYAASVVDSDSDTELLKPESPQAAPWDEPPGTLGYRSPAMPHLPEDSIAEQLITAGADEADTEQRAAARKAQ